MPTYVRDIVRDAMGKIGAVRVNEYPIPAELDLGIRVLNGMLGVWAADVLMLRAYTEDQIPLVANKSSYTIGPSGCDVTSAKPIRVRSGYVRDSDGLDSPLTIFTESRYGEVSNKSGAAATPYLIVYKPGATKQSVHIGTFVFYPVPDASYTAYVLSEKYLTEFTSPNELVQMEGVYYETLVYNLAVRLFHDYHKPSTTIPDDIRGIAHARVQTLENLNSQQLVSKIEVPGIDGSYNIYTDE